VPDSLPTIYFLENCKKKKSTSQQQQKMQQLIFFKFSFILLQYFSVTMAGKIINSSSNFSWRLRGVCICENGWIFKETPHGGGGSFAKNFVLIQPEFWSRISEKSRRPLRFSI